MGRANRILSFHKTGTAKKTKKIGGINIHTITQMHRQHGDLLSLLLFFKQVMWHTQTHEQQGNLMYFVYPLTEHVIMFHGTEAFSG
jgi:hypothetical protein